MVKQIESQLGKPVSFRGPSTVSTPPIFTTDEIFPCVIRPTGTFLPLHTHPAPIRRPLLLRELSFQTRDVRRYCTVQQLLLPAPTVPGVPCSPLLRGPGPNTPCTPSPPMDHPESTAQSSTVLYTHRTKYAGAPGQGIGQRNSRRVGKIRSVASLGVCLLACQPRRTHARIVGSCGTCSAD